LEVLLSIVICGRLKASVERRGRSILVGSETELKIGGFLEIGIVFAVDREIQGRLEAASHVMMGSTWQTTAMMKMVYVRSIS
jgi:hypothetical protein